MKKYLLLHNKNKIKTKKMITILIWMTGTVVSVMAISLQKETMDEITRDYNGDIFTIISSDCQKTNCDRDGRYAAPIAGSDCKCQCAPSHQVFREDINECVKDLIDCPLAAFIRPYLTERIPVVSLPVSSGQLIHPGAHLTISGLANLINSSTQLLCQIDNSEVMTPDGWQGISAHSHMFELYEDGNNTFLQWVGSDIARKHLHQKLVLVRLSCSGSGTALYKPCIAIRIGWVPGVSITGTVSESSSVLTLGNKVIAHQSNNYLIIGLCLGLLGLMYVLALMIYIKTKKSQLIKFGNSRNNNSRASNQLQSDSANRMESGNSFLNVNNNSSTNASNVTTSFSTDSESYSFSSESVVNDGNNTSNNRNDIQMNTQSKQSIDTVNEEFDTKNNVESVWTERSQNQNRSNQKIVIPERISRRCLQINPEYFEPELLLEPPPPALEFLQRIRELITNAKGRIRNFRFRPTLLVIPEDDYFYQDICKSLDTRCKPSEKTDGIDDEIPIPPPRHGRGKRMATPIAKREDSKPMTSTKTISRFYESDCQSNALNQNDSEDNSGHIIRENLNKTCDNFKEKSYSVIEFDKTDEYNKNDNNINKTNSFEHKENMYLSEELNESFSSQSKISRKEMLMKLKGMKMIDKNISDDNNSEEMRNSSNLKVNNEEMIVCEESVIDNANCNVSKTEIITPNNDCIDIDEDDAPFDSLKLLSAKVAKKLSEGSVPELSYKRNETEQNEHKMFQYWMKDFRNSFGSKPKSQISLLKTNDNWTLQRNSLNEKVNGFESNDSINSDNQTSVVENLSEKENNLIMSSNLFRKSNKNSIKKNSCQCKHLTNDSRNNYNNSLHLDFDPNLSLESNENNELNSFQSMNGYECDAETSTDTSSISSGEVSTTSSKENHFTSIESLESELTDDSLNKSNVYNDKNNILIKKNSISAESDIDSNDFQSEDYDNPIDACLEQLANTPIDGNHYSRIDRATKGMSALHKFKSNDWKHVCLKSHSQKPHQINGYQSDDTNSSTATSNNSMAFRATDDMTCSNARREDKPLSSPTISYKRRSCRMSAYNSTQSSNSENNFKIDNKMKLELYAKYSKTKQNSSKTVKSVNQSNSSCNNFNKLLTRHPNCTTKLVVYKGPLPENEICRNTKIPPNQQLLQVCSNGCVADDISSDESLQNFVRKNSIRKKLTNGSCKTYIQQRLKDNDETHYRNARNQIHHRIKPISSTLLQVSENDNQLKHICNNHRNIGSKGIVIEVNDRLDSHFVTRIPV